MCWCLSIIDPQPTFLPQCQRPSFTPIQNNRQNYSSVYLEASHKHTACRKCGVLGCLLSFKWFNCTHAQAVLCFATHGTASASAAACSGRQYGGRLGGPEESLADKVKYCISLASITRTRSSQLHARTHTHTHHIWRYIPTALLPTVQTNVRNLPLRMTTRTRLAPQQTYSRKKTHCLTNRLYLK